MSTELGRAYEVLGVKPGVSDRELKAAHRDLAKVWHPDRFQHDPRLQEKAQEKLKEINEAYEQLISRHKRPFVAPQEPPRTERATARKTGHRRWVLVPLVLFILVFAVTTKVLQPRPVEVVELRQLDQKLDQKDDTQVAAPAPKRKTEPEPVPTPAATQPVEAVTALPTVTVTIDPETGRLATPACPSKSRMTYPSGSEPREYCNAAHPVPTKDPRLKALTKRIRSL